MTEIGIAQLMASFGYDNLTDGRLYQEELQVALAAEEHGYDHIWVVEHHFEDYALCPDNVVYLSHVAAMTKRIKLATGVIILPWHLQPLRVAERIALFDQLANGRAILGFGRGLAGRDEEFARLFPLAFTNQNVG